MKLKRRIMRAFISYSYSFQELYGLDDTVNKIGGLAYRNLNCTIAKTDRDSTLRVRRHPHALIRYSKLPHLCRKPLHDRTAHSRAITIDTAPGCWLCCSLHRSLTGNPKFD